MRDAEAAETVKSLLLNSKFLQNRVQGAAKEVALEIRRGGSRLENIPFLSIPDVFAEEI
jgi:hypothetical protein